MKLLDRFRHLSLWNKLGAIGAAASIIGLVLFLPDVLGKEEAGEPSSPTLDVDMSGSGNQAMVQAGGNVSIQQNVDQRDPNEVGAARKLLVEEVLDNMWAAEEHVGLCTVLQDAELWPAATLAKTLNDLRLRFQGRPFRKDAYLAAQTKEELVVDGAWRYVRDFYTHIDQGIERVGRDQLDALESVLSMEAPGKDLYCPALETWISTVEGNYHVLEVVGRVALEEIIGSEETAKELANLRFLPLCSGEAGENALSVKLRKRCEAELSPLPPVLCAQIYAEIAGLDRSDVDEYLALASRARQMDCRDAADLAYEKVLERFPGDHTSVAYVRAGRDQLEHPERYKNLRGLFVTDFTSSSVGRAAGLRVGDVIIGYDGRPIDTHDDIEVGVRSATREVVEILLVRAGETLRVEVPRGSMGVEYRGF